MHMGKDAPSVTCSSGVWGGQWLSDSELWHKNRGILSMTGPVLICEILEGAPCPPATLPLGSLSSGVFLLSYPAFSLLSWPATVLSCLLSPTAYSSARLGSCVRNSHQPGLHFSKWPVCQYSIAVACESQIYKIEITVPFCHWTTLYPESEQYYWDNVHVVFWKLKSIVCLLSTVLVAVLLLKTILWAGGILWDHINLMGFQFGEVKPNIKTCKAASLHCRFTSIWVASSVLDQTQGVNPTVLQKCTSIFSFQTRAKQEFCPPCSYVSLVTWNLNILTMSYIVMPLEGVTIPVIFGRK